MNTHSLQLGNALATPAGQTAWRKFAPQTGIVPFIITCIFAVTTVVECHSAVPGTHSLLSWLVGGLYGAVQWIWWAPVVELLWRANKRWPSTLRVSLSSCAANLFIAMVLVVLHLGLLQMTTRWIGGIASDPELRGYRGLQFFCLPRLGIELLLYALVWLACAAIYSQLVAQRNAVHSLELERQLSSAHLHALQMQMEPHFLFNTLNAVTTLMELDRTPDALETLGNLNTILKAVLKRDNPGKIPLAQELVIVESYLAIERVRFADRLRVAIDLDPSALDGLVPCFLLQPIVENAIRHGIAHCESDGLIETSARRVGNHMHLLIRDNGPGLNGHSRPGFGVGLRNTKERLLHFYERDHEFRAYQPESGGFEVSITIPYERASDSASAPPRPSVDFAPEKVSV